MDIALDPEHAPVGAQLINKIGEILTNASEDGYDVDGVLLALVVAVFGVEQAALRHKAELLRAKAELFRLETRILQAGVRLEPREE